MPLHQGYFEPFDKRTWLADDVKDDKTQRTAECTKFFPSNNLNNSGSVRVQHIMQTLDMRKAVFPSEARLKGKKSRRYLYYVIIQYTDMSESGHSLSRKTVLDIDHEPKLVSKISIKLLEFYAKTLAIGHYSYQWNPTLENCIRVGIWIYPCYQ